MSEYRDIYNARVSAGDDPNVALETTVTLLDILNRRNDELRKDFETKLEADRNSRQADRRWLLATIIALFGLTVVINGFMLNLAGVFSALAK